MLSNLNVAQLAGADNIDKVKDFTEKHGGIQQFRAIQRKIHQLDIEIVKSNELTPPPGRDMWLKKIKKNNALEADN